MNVPKLRFGEFEDEWQKVELGHLTKNISSGKSKPNSDSGFPVYGSMGVIGYSSEFTHSGKTLLIARVGANAGTTNIVEGEISVTDNTLIVSLNHSNTSEFICVLLQRENLNQMAFGSGQPLITAGQLKKLNIYIPEETEQQKIADFLSAVDEKITALAAQKTALTQYKQGMMQRIFNQTLRFKDDNGEDYPEWEAKIFDAIAKRTSQKFNPEVEIDDFPCIELEHLEQGTGVVLGVVSAKGQKSIKTRFEKGNVLFGKLRPYLRKYTLAKFNGVCSSEIWVFVGVKVCNEYLYYLIQSDDFMNAVDSTSGSKMPRAEWDMLKSMEFSYPASKKEQIKIAQLLTELDDKINAVDAQIQSAQQWKQGLLQQMFV